MINFESHPISVVYDLVNRYGDGFVLSFSRYLYRPQSPLDEREVFNVGVSEVGQSWLEDQIGQLHDGWELALNSEVIDSRNRRFHIPMIDFAGRETSFFFTKYFRAIVGVGFNDSMLVFDSGRSFHAYSPTLISNKAWVRFMGGLLLLTLPGQTQIVDDRWVGHRLRGGYSALRWSCRSGNYLKIPEFVSLSNIFREKHARDLGD